MKKNISYSELYTILNELYTQLQKDNYPVLYLNAIQEVQSALLVLELLNIAYSSKLN